MDQFSLITPVLRCISRALRPCPFSLTQLAVAYCPAFPTLDVFRGRINKSVSHDMKSVGFHNQLSVDIGRFSTSSPKGCKLVAGGRSVSADHRIAELEIIGTLIGCEIFLDKFSHPFRVRIPLLRDPRWSSLRFDHRLLSGNASGL